MFGSQHVLTDRCVYFNSCTHSPPLLLIFFTEVWGIPGGQGEVMRFSAFGADGYLASAA